MTQEEIINGSKLIAEFLGWVYIPFEPNLGSKLGWFAPAPKGSTIISMIIDLYIPYKHLSNPYQNHPHN